MILDSRLKSSKEDENQDEETLTVMREIEKNLIQEATDVQETTPDNLANANDGSATTPMGRWSGLPRSRSHGQKMTVKERDRAMEVGLRNMIGVNKIAEKIYLQRSPMEQAQKAPNNAWGKSKVRKLTPGEISKALSVSENTVLDEAKKNGYVPFKPLRKLEEREKALTEIVASLPFVDATETHPTKKIITNAIRMFDHKPRSNQKNEWKMSGLESNLFQHQVQGVGWMVRALTSLSIYLIRRY